MLLGELPFTKLILLLLTSAGSVGGIEIRTDLSVCKNASIDGFFFGLTSASSSVTCPREKHTHKYHIFFDAMHEAPGIQL